jgi:hypothetical protein
VQSESESSEDDSGDDSPDWDASDDESDEESVCILVVAYLLFITQISLQEEEQEAAVGVRRKYTAADFLKDSYKKTDAQAKDVKDVKPEKPKPVV